MLMFQCHRNCKSESHFSLKNKKNSMYVNNLIMFYFINSSDNILCKNRMINLHKSNNLTLLSQQIEEMSEIQPDQTMLSESSQQFDFENNYQIQSSTIIYYQFICLWCEVFVTFILVFAIYYMQRYGLKSQLQNNRQNLSPDFYVCLFNKKYYKSLINNSKIIIRRQSMKKFAQFRQKAIHQTPTAAQMGSQKKQPQIRQSQQMGSQKFKQGGSQHRRQRDHRLNINRQKYTRAKSIKQQLQSPLKFGKSLICKSVQHTKEQGNDQIYQKTKDLKLADYLTLYSMSKKSQADKSIQKITNKSQTKILSTQPGQDSNKNNSHTLMATNQNSHRHFLSKTQRLKLKTHQKSQDQNEKWVQNSNSIQNSKLKFAIDTEASIKVVKQQTKKSLLDTKRDLEKFLQKINQSHHVKSDEQSLVFMCNVLHIFQDKITQSVRLAQQLIDERKKQKNLIVDKSIFINSGMRKGRKSRNKSQVSEPSQIATKSFDKK